MTMTLGRPGDADKTPGERAAQGGRAAFADIVADHQARVTRLACRLLGWPNDVEDVVQDVFLAALEHLPRFRGDSSLATWLTAIAVNKCRSVRRRRLLRLRLLSWARGRLPRQAGQAADCGPLRRERHEQVRRAVGRLPGRLREVVVLRYLEEMPIEQIAKVLRISPGAVGSRLHRARLRLAAELSGRIEE
jgi:RNA polymerase sigma factor (sigma-70 family)